MNPNLVYLHIPKSAGTSHRTYLVKVYGEDSVFWYGLDSNSAKFKANEVAGSHAIGGHLPLDFYPESFEALYSSVVRDPVERAVSFFNYCTELPKSHSDSFLQDRKAALARWQKQGVDPSSMARSINQSAAFRKEISNLQCRYLSRFEPTFEGVLKTLETENMVVGLFEKLPLFNQFLEKELNFPIENLARANVGRQGYASNIFQEPGLIELIRSINVEDQLLYDFLRFECGGLYVGASNLEAIKEYVPTLENSNSASSSKSSSADSIDWADINLFCKGITKPSPDGTLAVVLVVNNTGKERLRLTKDRDESRSIGWQALDKDGEQIQDYRGTVKVEQVIPGGQFRTIYASISLPKELLHETNAQSLEFSIVDGGEWLNSKHPLNSTWSLFITGK